jgi:hypothetical protein
MFMNVFWRDSHHDFSHRRARIKSFINYVHEAAMEQDK